MSDVYGPGHPQWEAGVHPSGGESLTKQSEKDDADINKLMEKFQRTGIVPPLNGRQAMYGDFSSGEDFTRMMQRVSDAEEEFLSLPAAVRDACDNDPGKFLDLVSDEKNREKLEKLGLVKAYVPERVQKVEVVNPQSPGDDPEEVKK